MRTSIVQKIRVTRGSRAIKKRKSFRGLRSRRGGPCGFAGRWNVDCGEEGFDFSILGFFDSSIPREIEGSKNEEWLKSERKGDKGVLNLLFPPGGVKSRCNSGI